MPKGDKSAYTDKQKRQAAHIEQSYKARGAPEVDAERRAWATVNKESGGGKKSGSGRQQAATKKVLAKSATKRAKKVAVRKVAEKKPSGKRQPK